MAISNIVIIGGGLGGLNLAHALKGNPNISVTVYERDKAPEARGQGWNLGINRLGRDALRAAKVPGIEELLAINMVSAFSVFDAQLNLLAQMGEKKLTSTDTDSAIVSRRQLRETLMAGINIVWNKHFSHYEEFPDHVVAYFEDGTMAKADFIVGADGSRSAVRKQRAPEIIYKELPYISIGAIVPPPPSSTIPRIRPVLEYSMLRVLSSCGLTVIMGICKDDDGTEQMLWGLSQPTSGLDDKQLPTNSEELVSYCAAKAMEHFHPEVANVIRHTPANSLLFGGARRVHSTIPTKRNLLATPNSSRVTLLGDAAHAMTTHRGMGANTALADSIDIAYALQQEDWQAAMKDCQEKIWARGYKAVSESLLSTRMIHSTGWMAFGTKLMFRIIGYIMSLRSSILTLSRNS